MHSPNWRQTGEYFSIFIRQVRKQLAKNIDNDNDNDNGLMISGHRPIIMRRWGMGVTIQIDFSAIGYGH
jgi:hypothetical protein